MPRPQIDSFCEVATHIVLYLNTRTGLKMIVLIIGGIAKIHATFIQEKTIFPSEYRQNEFKKRHF